MFIVYANKYASNSLELDFVFGTNTGECKGRIVDNTTGNIRFLNS